MIDASPKPTADRRYLGDGVTATFDGYQIWLRAERDSMTHEIAIEPQVFVALEKYVADLRAGVA